MSTQKSLHSSRITIGSFDGLHIGHQTIIHDLVTGAQQSDQSTVLVTFSPNPLVYFKQIRTPFYLTVDDEKEHLIDRLGVEETLILPFTKQLAATPAEDFTQMLHKRLQFDHLYVGYDFRFGAGRKGDPDLLKNMGAQLGFTVHVQSPITKNQLPVSSSHIRNLVSNGHLAQARPLLGRDYLVMGKVIHGDGRGKKIGVPTANIETKPEKLLPPHGIYATRIHIGDETRPAAVSIGVRPTFYDRVVPATIEAHILDWSQDIYGKTISLEFVELLRDEIQYSGAAALTKQINKDIQRTREIIEYE